MQEEIGAEAVQRVSEREGGAHAAVHEGSGDLSVDGGELQV